MLGHVGQPLTLPPETAPRRPPLHIRLSASRRVRGVHLHQHESPSRADSSCVGDRMAGKAMNMSCRVWSAKWATVARGRRSLPLRERHKSDRHAAFHRPPASEAGGGGVMPRSRRPSLPPHLGNPLPRHQRIATGTQLVFRFGRFGATFATEGVQKTQSLRLPALPRLVAIRPIPCNTCLDAFQLLLRQGVID